MPTASRLKALPVGATCLLKHPVSAALTYSAQQGMPNISMQECSAFSALHLSTSGLGIAGRSMHAL